MIKTEQSPSMSDMQRTCLRLVGKGLSSKEIAQLTHLSPNTVDQYVYRATIALSASNRRHAARLLEKLEAEGLKNFEFKPERIAASLFSAPHCAAEHGEEAQTEPVLIPIDETSVTCRDVWNEGRAGRTGFLPPLGGVPNDLTPSRTIQAISRIALAVGISASALTATTVWVMALFH